MVVSSSFPLSLHTHNTLHDSLLTHSKYSLPYQARSLKWGGPQIKNSYTIGLKRWGIRRGLGLRVWGIGNQPQYTGVVTRDPLPHVPSSQILSPLTTETFSTQRREVKNCSLLGSPTSRSRLLKHRSSS